MGLMLHHGAAGTSTRRVFIALPSYGQPSGITAYSLFKAHAELLQAGWEVELCMLLGDCHVDDARNTLVNRFLQSGCSDLVFIDADMGFQANDLIRLLSYDRDVVGGGYPKKSDRESFPVWIQGGETWSEEDGLIECIGIGTGFLRIRRHVLETLAASSVRYANRDFDGDVALIFERLIVNGNRYSGDIAFCKKWRDLGGKVYVDPDCYLEHRGEKTWAGTYGSYLRKQNGVSLTQGINRIRAGTETDSDYISLEREWGNDGYTAGVELIKACVMSARQVKGPVLETGSGITTLVMAAANPAITVHALEHSPIWAAHVESEAKRLGLTNIVIHCAPLVEYPAGKWYAIPRLAWEDVELAVLDGPPRQEGNRKISFGVMATKGCAPKCILVDDADTEGDSIPAPYKTEIKGQLRKFAVGLRK